MDDSERMHLGEDRRSNRRSVVRWIPDFSAGTVALIVTWLAGIGGLYAGITSDNAKRDEKIATVQRDREEDRKQFSAALKEIKDELRETSRSVNETQKSVAILAGQLPLLQGAPSPARTNR